MYVYTQRDSKRCTHFRKTGLFLKWVKIQKTSFSNRTELHPIDTGMLDVFWMNLYLNDG
jgi:hypothetical protein